MLWSSLAFENCTGFRIQHNTPNECFVLPYGLSRKPLKSSVIFLASVQCLIRQNKTGLSSLATEV